MKTKHRKKKMTQVPDENVEMYAEKTLVDLAVDKKPLEFAEQFHFHILARIKEMLDPYREQIAHDLMKNEVDEEVNEDEQLDEKKDNEYGKEYSKMYNERKKFFKKKAKGMTKPIMKEGEEQLDELSKKVLGKYMKKASKEAVGLAGDITKKGKRDPKTLNKFKNRVTGVHYAKSVVDAPDDED